MSFTRVKNHKSLLSVNISASPGCSTVIAFREMSQHLTVSRFILFCFGGFVVIVVLVLVLVLVFLFMDYWRS